MPHGCRIRDSRRREPVSALRCRLREAGSRFDALPFDKKFERGRIRFVVTPKLGTACLSSDITMQDIEEAVAQL